MRNKNLGPADQKDINTRAEQSHSADIRKNAIGKSKESNKKKHFKVLHKDGSLADLPYNNQPGAGALEGTVGIGT